MGRKFVRTIENFVCDNCGESVTGNGYTNHCPKCLHSKHVDINPGDRESSCNGMMAPVGIDRGRKGYVIVFRCLKCNATKRNKASEGDSLEMIARVSAQGNGGS